MKRFSESFIRSAPPGRHTDSQTPRLQLYVKPSGARSYVQRIVVDGVRRDFGLGSPRWLTLDEAREVAMANFRAARRGEKIERPSGRKPIPTVADVVESVLVVQRSRWRAGSKSEAQWRASLREHAGALLLRRVDEVTTADILGVLKPIWHSKHETAKRVRQRLSLVFRHAVAEGHRPDNPVAAVGAVLGSNGHHSEHFEAVPHAEVGEVLAKVEASRAYAGTKLLLRFLALTAVRSGEARGARWDEVNIDSRTWTVPGQRTKSGRAHRVPLSDAALAALGDARHLFGAHPSGLCFPSARGREASDSTVSKLFRELGIAGKPHGLRSSFRDWCGETGIAREVAEACLAHVVKDKAEAAYARTDYLDIRREVMEQWAGYIAAEALSNPEMSLNDEGRQAVGVRVRRCCE